MDSQPISAMPNTFLQQGSLEIIGDPHPEWMIASVLPGKVRAREMPVLHQAGLKIP